MSVLLDQVKQRRITLGLKQHDMMLRVGMSRQQYQRLESKGNPRLDTFEVIAQGLNSELLLIPKDKLKAVLDVLAADTSPTTPQKKSVLQESAISEDPWQGLLEDHE